MLVLVPTPLNSKHPLNPQTLSMLLKYLEKGNSCILVEEAKSARRRWINWGLDRRYMDDFIIYNEHTQKKELTQILNLLQNKKTVFLLSDLGLPAFCDPGCELVSLCHDHDIKVTATPFYNSTLLALALSGFCHKRFYFAGFLHRNQEIRKEEIEKLKSFHATIIIMDTAYRREALLNQLYKTFKNERRFLLALDLNGANERLIRGYPEDILEKTKSLKKLDFVLLIEAL